MSNTTETRPDSPLFTRDAFGTRLAELRKANGLTQADVSDRLAARGCGVIKQTVSHWECGRAQPDPNTICHLADILGVGVGLLMRGES
jgi:transcriptional regulator with XRE-family HTH domain